MHIAHGVADYNWRAGVHLHQERNQLDTKSPILYSPDFPCCFRNCDICCFIDAINNDIDCRINRLSAAVSDVN
ncbi:hypothetical protein AVEN_18284-1 [Araneus ventricosus]|uniref:Uncharacterized protein n=1 Tax=Araneus ventricosus TaxID=182803 RepID=A0A4Y2AJ00_ARAVE|nr:hypothetical protein AVEN_18284-1 [Araneus ventricosus]